ncbi:MAG: hypothetical protein WCI77_05840 [Candidatus Omnitrophota bacterium]
MAYNFYTKTMSIVGIFFASGCATMSHMDELLTLQNAADSQNDMECYLKKQERGFNQLQQDVKSNKLQPGILKRYIIEMYYEPILSKEENFEGTLRQVLLYRHPTHYFNSERIYLYFDRANRLTSWKIVSAD